MLAATLPPEAGDRVADLAPACLVCGARGTADLLLNAGLFAPLGAAVARPGGKAGAVAAAVAAGLALSGCVEAAQLVVPGRHTAVGDLVANAAGAGAGGLLSVSAHRWLRPDDRAAGALSTAWGLSVAAVALATSTLLVPAPTPSDYWGQHAPDLGHLERFPGEVLAASAGGLPVPEGRLDPSTRRRVVAAVTRTPRLSVTARFGAPPDGLAPVFSVFDGRQREVFVLGQDGRDGVFRLRRRADAARLRRPAIVAEGLLAGIAPGDTATLAVGPGEGPGICLRAGDARRCGLGHPVGGGWALLVGPDLPAAVAGAVGTEGREGIARALDAAWIALLFLPLGYWAAPAWGWRVGLVLAGGGLLAAPAVGPVLAAGAAEASGLAAGLGVGLLLRGLVARAGPSGA